MTFFYPVRQGIFEVFGVNLGDGNTVAGVAHLHDPPPDPQVDGARGQHLGHEAGAVLQDFKFVPLHAEAAKRVAQAFGAVAV